MMRQNPRRLLTAAILFVLLALPQAGLAGSGSCTPTGKLLLPYFDVHPQQLDVTTIFVLTNLGKDAAKVTIDVHNQKGRSFHTEKVDFKGFQEKVFDIGEHFKNGDLKLNQFKDPDNPKAAIGYVSISANRPTFCGNFYIVKEEMKEEDGEMLIDPSDGLCKTHALLLRKSGVFDSDSYATIWIEGSLNTTDTLDTFGYDENGNRKALKSGIRLERTQVVPLKDLGWEDGIQWIELVNKDRPSFVLARYFDNEGERASMLRTCCFGGGCDDCGGGGECPRNASISVDKKTNGKDNAGDVKVDSTVTWTYTIKNTGGIALDNVKVVDNPMPSNLTCSDTKLAPGKSMTCTASGTAVKGAFTNTATVTANVSGRVDCPVRASDSSKYNGVKDDEPCRQRPAITLDKKTNGKGNAGKVEVGSTVNWTYMITNTGDVPLVNVQLTDNPLPSNLSCPKTQLALNESMTCTASGQAVAGRFTNTAKVTADSKSPNPTCLAVRVSAVDTGVYEGDCVEGRVSISLDKKTNGQDNAGDIPAGDPITWTYLVKNDGEAILENVQLTDSPDPGTISCTRQANTSLLPGASFTCQATGTAVEGNFSNTATVTAVSSCKKKSVKDSDKSRYKGMKADRFMTGGAFIMDTPFGKVDVQITKLNCDGSKPNNLNVEWGGQGNQRQKFMMQTLKTVTCSDQPGIDPSPPDADFDTAVGTGEGRVKNKKATISFKFVDAGEPGTGDEFDITINIEGGETIHVAGKIDGGNYQAHK